MEIVLNRKQIERLADFLFDIAKGLFLGAVGATLTNKTQIPIVLAGGLLSILCVGIALWLLKRL